MAGGLVQLVYIGNADKVLTQMPHITFFKIQYCRYLSHATEDYILKPERAINMSTLDGDRNTDFIIRPFADLAYRPMLRITVPTIQVSYKHDISYYVTMFLKSMRMNPVTSNVILSSLRTIMYNYYNMYNTVYIDESTIVSFSYNNLNYGEYSRLTSIDVDGQYDINDTTSYNQLIKCDIINNPGTVTSCRHIYHGSQNSNYLTKELSKYNFTDELIYVDDDFYEMFRTNLYKFITKDDDNKFVYSLLNNKSPRTLGYEKKNIKTKVIDEITFSLEYLFTNMKLFFIYNSSNSLKSVYSLNSYAYSSKTYVNKVSPINNLYDIFEALYDDENQLFISDGFSQDKQFNIHVINSVTKNGISYNIDSSIVPNSENLYFIFPNKSPDYQGKTYTDTVPGTEDYYDLYYNDLKTDSKIFGPNDMLLPLCMLTYNSDTGLYDTIEFDYNITSSDQLYVYKDVLIFDQLSKEIEYILIGNNLHEVIDSHSYDGESVSYSESINVGKHTEIENGIIRSFENDEIQFLVTDDGFNTMLVGERIYKSADFTNPFKIKLNLESNLINRLIPILSSTTVELNLDTYNNVSFILDTLEDYNITISEELSTLYQNISITKEENLTNIINCIQTFLNSDIYFKLYNKITYNQSTQTTTVTIDPTIITNMLSHLFPDKLNGIDRYYSQVQNIITDKINTFIDNVDTINVDNIRSISNIDSLELVNTIVNIETYTFSHYIPVFSSDATYSTTNEETSLPLSKILFQISSDYNNILTDISGLNIDMNMDSEYFYVPDIIFELKTSDSGDTIRLSPLNDESLYQYHIFNMLANAPIKDGNYAIDTFYIVPNDAIISELDISGYEFIIEHETSSPSVYSMFDSLSNNNSKHFTELLYSNQNNPKPASVELKYILYHYAQSLYLDLYDRVPIDIVDSNAFFIYNSMKMHKYLQHIRMLIRKNHVVGNFSSLKDLSTLVSGSTFYLDNNICMAQFLDHVIINNTLRQNVENYILEQIKPIVNELLILEDGVFNFFQKNQTIEFYLNSGSSSISVDLNLIDGLTTIKWYLFYLSSIQSDVKGYIYNDLSIDIIHDLTVEKTIELLSFFEQNNLFNDETYKGENITFTIENFSKVEKLNKKILDMISFISNSIDNRIIDNGNGDLVTYAKDIGNTIIEKLDINNLTLDNLINKIPQLYGYNFYLSYKYKTQLSFYNKFKQQYLDLYYNIFDSLVTYGSYSNKISNELFQYMNFSLDDYVKQLDWLCTNTEYENNEQFIFATTTFLDENKFKFSTVSNIDNIASTLIKTVKMSSISSGNTTMINGKNLLNIKFQSLEEIKSNFNKFFTYQYSFYSDYKIIYALYFHLYKTFSFSTYELTFNKSDNTSSDNNISDGINVFPYSWISFGNDKIRYTVKNDKLYDISENIAINYYINNESIVENQMIKCDEEYDLFIVGNDIVDLSENHMYIIRVNDIYNNSEKVGYIDMKYGHTIYYIGENQYKYEVLSTKKRVLFNNFQVIDVTDSTIINSETYDVFYNIFYDENRDIKFKFMLPFLTNPGSEINNLFPIVIDNETETVYNLIPETLYDSTVNISDVFSETFASSYCKKSISYLQDTVLNSLYETDINGSKTIQNNSVVKLLHNICSNSILPLNTYIDDTIKACSLNNMIKDKGFEKGLEIALLYETPNKLVIFDQTDQSILELEDSVNIDHDLCFFPTTDELIPNDVSHGFTTVNSLSISLQKAKLMKAYNIVSLEDKKIQLRDFILNTILDDIENSTVSPMYNTEGHFNITDTVTWSNGDMTDDSYVIRNVNIISKNELLGMEILTNSEYTFSYINGIHYLIDMENKMYPISTIQLSNYDISYNNCTLKFTNDSVLIDTTLSTFPKTILLSKGKISRLDNVGHGQIIDSSYNLVSNLSYDLQVHKMLQISKMFNDQQYDEGNTDDIIGTLIDTYTFENTTVIYNDENRYLTLDSSENLVGQNVLIEGDGQKSMAYVEWQEGSNIKVYLESDLILNEQYTVKRNIVDILRHMGFNLFFPGTVFHFYETFLQSYVQLNQFVTTNNDTSFSGQKFSCNNYINNLYGNLYVTINKTMFESNESVTLDKTDKIYNMSSMDKTIMKTMYENVINLKKNHLKNVERIESLINRDPIPKCNWIDYLGYFFVKNVKFNMGNETIEEINDHIIYTYNRRRTDSSKEEGINEMIGHNCYLQMPQTTIKGKILYIPLPVGFEKESCALPLQALMNTILNLNVTIRNLDNLIVRNPDTEIKLLSKTKVELNLTYVFLEDEARAKFARSRHEYLYEIKHCYEHVIEKQEDDILLEYENPCKEISWFYLDRAVSSNKQYWNYSGFIRKNYNIDDISILTNTTFDIDDDIKYKIKSLINAREKYHKQTIIFRDDTLPIYSLSSMEIKTVIQSIKNREKPNNPFILTKLDLNGQNRFSMEGNRTELVEPTLFTKEKMVPGLNQRSFGRKTDLTHMGSLNLSMCNDMYFHYELNQPANGSLFIITNTYQIIRIMSGIGTSLWK